MVKQGGRTRSHRERRGEGLAWPHGKTRGLPIARDSKNEPERFYEQ